MKFFVAICAVLSILFLLQTTGSMACNTNKDCNSDQCCTWMTGWDFACVNYIKVGEKCSTGQLRQCGCEPGLTCLDGIVSLNHLFSVF